MSFWKQLFQLKTIHDSSKPATMLHCQKCGATFSQPPNQNCPLCGGAGSLTVGKPSAHGSSQSGKTPLRPVRNSTPDAYPYVDGMVIQCEKCKTIFEPGRDAGCITPSEMAKLLGPMALNMGINIMIARAPENYEGLLRDREAILRLGRGGWTCKECHHDNQWRPRPRRP
jgi:hypothetical protein